MHHRRVRAYVVPCLACALAVAGRAQAATSSTPSTTYLAHVRSDGNLALSATPEAQTRCPGTTVDWTIRVRNDGPCRLAAPALTDDFDPGLTYTGDDRGSTGTDRSRTWSFPTDTLEVGDSLLIHLQATLDPNCEPGAVAGRLQAQATAACDAPAPATASFITTVACAGAVCAITPPDPATCPGGTTEICGPDVAGNRFLWSTGETTRCIMAGPGCYNLQVTNAAGCVDRCDICVNELPQPVCAIAPGNPTACLGQTAEICGPEGDGFTYLWSTGATSRCIDAGPGCYTLRVTSATGCADTCHVCVTQAPGPVCTITTSSAVVCPGQTTELCGPEGQGLGYLWSTGATSNCIDAGPGCYTLRVTTASGCFDTCHVCVTEQPRPICAITPARPAACAGQTTEICGPVGDGLGYLWSTGATDRCITVGPGCYSLRVTDAAGCSDTCHVCVAAATSPSCSISGVDSLCPGDRATLCGPAGDFTYRWNPGGESTRCIDVASPGTYTLVVGDRATGCASEPCSRTVRAGICGGPVACRLTGRGCLEVRTGKGPKDHTFGGNVSPDRSEQESDGDWYHIQHKGRGAAFKFQSHDAHIVSCAEAGGGPCGSRADFEGTGRFSAGKRSGQANFSAFVIDRGEDCDERDYYSITVREGSVAGSGKVVFSAAGTLDCGKLHVKGGSTGIVDHDDTPPGPESGSPSPDADAFEAGTLDRAIPNPFTGTMSYSYRVPEGEPQPVEVGTYDIAGRLVRSLASGMQGPGRYTIQWDGRNQAGVTVTPGIYFLRARVAGDPRVTRVIYLHP